MQPREDLFDFLLHLPPSRGFELVLHFFEFRHQLFIVAMCQLGAHLMILGKQFPLLAESRRVLPRSPGPFC